MQCHFLVVYKQNVECKIKLRIKIWQEFIRRYFIFSYINKLASAYSDINNLC